jgi:hypothetical protein
MCSRGVLEPMWAPQLPQVLLTGLGLAGSWLGVAHTLTPLGLVGAEQCCCR